MRLHVEGIHSTIPLRSDTDQRGVPDDPKSFAVPVECFIGDEGGSELFHILVCSPDRIQARVDELGFLRQALVIDVFSWEEVEIRIDRLLESIKDYPWERQYYTLVEYMYPVDLGELLDGKS